MPMWNPWRGCHKYSEGCRYCYIHKGDFKRKIDTNDIVKTDNFYAPIAKNKSGEYKIKSGQTVYLCFSTDFLIEEADEWRPECWQMIKERSDLHFLFLTKRIERFMDCIPDDWQDGYDNVTVGCTVENLLIMIIKLKLLREKRHYAIYKALGYTTVDIMTQIAISMVILGAIGSLVGALVGAITTSPILSLFGGYIGAGHLDFVIPWGFTVAIIFGICALVYLVSMLCAISVRRIRPAMER